MATTLASDLKIYNEQLEGGRAETIAQNTDAFNAASNGSILMTSEFVKGEYEYESFFPSVSSLITRQDLTSTSAATATKFTEDENISVKLHRKYLHEMSRKAFRMRGNGSVDEGFFALGQMLAKAEQTDKLNLALSAARVALEGESEVLNDVTGGTDGVTYADLLATMAKMGDAADNIVAWVMHSTQWFDLASGVISDNAAYTNIADGVIRSVEVPGLGRPILITDSASLINTTPTPDAYYVLGLTNGAIEVKESSPMDSVVDEVSGLEQLVLRAQGEYAYNLSLKGFKWDVSNGGANPADAAVGTGTNWDKVATSHKDLAGVVLKCEDTAQSG